MTTLAWESRPADGAGSSVPDAERRSPDASNRRLFPNGRRSSRLSKTPERISVDIIRNIVALGLKPGARLPSQLDLARHYGVSRPTLREALFMLETQGLLTIKPGKGVAVGRASPVSVARTLALSLTLAGVDYDELLDAWILAEPLLARLAAENPDRARVSALITPFLAEALQADELASGGGGLYAAIGKLAGNRALALMLTSVGMMVGQEFANDARPRQISEVRRGDHRDIARAILDADADRAGRLMADHVRQVAEEFRALQPTATEERPWPRRFAGEIFNTGAVTAARGSKKE
jgi:GntR family transcriptional repressor for pyruvate dehydrogenase complex